jgi:signal peptidase I
MPTVSHRRQPWHRSLDLILRSLLEILVVGIFITTFIAVPIRIPSSSMQPTLRPGDLAIADRQSFAPETWARALFPSTAIRRGELAVFRFPPDPQRDLVKRVVGLPGDRIRLHDGRLLVNGLPVAETYAVYSSTTPENFRDNFPSLRSLDPEVDPQWWTELRRSTTAGEIVVPPGHFFVLGDNRDDSDDSRYWGFVPQDHFVARPLFVYFGAVRTLH